MSKAVLSFFQKLIWIGGSDHPLDLGDTLSGGDIEFAIGCRFL